MPFARMIRTNERAQQVSLFTKLLHFPHFYDIWRQLYVMKRSKYRLSCSYLNSLGFTVNIREVFKWTGSAILLNLVSIVRQSIFSNLSRYCETYYHILNNIECTYYKQSEFFSSSTNIIVSHQTSAVKVWLN